MPPDTVTVYTDGACSGNPGPGGWAWAVAPDGEPSASGGEPRTTNQRMEITAVLRAVEALPGPVHVMSDSTYVVNCFRDRWWEGWLLRVADSPVAYAARSLMVASMFDDDGHLVASVAQEGLFRRQW